MRTLLIDGTNIFIMNYAANPTLDADGKPSGGISGTLKSLRKIVRDVKPDRVIFVWDGPGGSVKKKKLFNEYKKGRRPRVIAGRTYAFESVDKAVENKIWQTKTLRSFLDCLPICQIVAESIEADDAIAYLANHADYFGFKSCIIATCDKDFYQLVDDTKVIFNPMRKKLITTGTMIEETGYHPKNWLFFKAINGDKSDNVDGIKGIGPKTIAKLFDVENGNKKLTPDSIREAYSNISTLKKKTHQKWLNQLNENLDLIERNWKLMSLEDVMVSIDMKDRLTSIVENFVPTLDKPKFYVRLMELGGLGIPTTFFNEFRNLKSKK